MPKQVALTILNPARSDGSMSGSLQERFSRISAFKPARKREPVLPELKLRESRRLSGQLRSANCQDGLLAQTGRASWQEITDGEHPVCRQWYATPEMCEPSEEVVLRLLLPPKCEEKASRILRCAPLSLEKWLFLDTETTGLSGGTGTYAVPDRARLVGMPGGLRVEQLFSCAITTKSIPFFWKFPNRLGRTPGSWLRLTASPSIGRCSRIVSA